MLIRRGDYWYEFGADGAASSFTAISSDTLENKTINTSDNTITVASADVTGLSSSLALKSPLVSPTFTGTVTTAAVDVAGNNIDNVQNVIHDISAMSGTAINFDNDQVETMGFSATLTLTTSNRAIGRSKTLKMSNTSGSTQTLNFPAGWIFVGAKPTDIAGNKTAILTCTCFGTADTDIVSAYAVEA